jgi:hypothetical protein
LGLIATVLFIPILSFLTEVFFSCNNGEVSGEGLEAVDGSVVTTCWEGGQIFKSVVTVVLMAMFIWYVLYRLVLLVVFEGNNNLLFIVAWP